MWAGHFHHALYVHNKAIEKTQLCLDRHLKLQTFFAFIEIKAPLFQKLGVFQFFMFIREHFAFFKFHF